MGNIFGSGAFKKRTRAEFERGVELFEFGKVAKAQRLFESLLQHNEQDKALRLYVETACETAAGSDRDALGIAGISLQAGAKSAVASLWQVDDEATAQIITKFYQGLREGSSKAKALQIAQKTWLKEHRKGLYSHPGFWAPFILIGNWL